MNKTKAKVASALPNVYPGEYRFVPAAYYSSNANGLGMYVRYRKNPGVTTVEKRSQDARHIWLRTPDRDVILVRMTHEHPFYPSEGDFDEFVNLSLYQEQSARDLGFDYYMTNYCDYLGKEQQSPRNRIVRDPKSISVISDSGGFQFLTGKLDYLNPRELVRWYNENADIGIVLDMPIGSKIIDKGLHNKLAVLQKANTDLMLEEAAPGLELMNVVHGVDTEAKLRFNAHVQHASIRRLAVGGSYFDTVMSSVATILKFHEQVQGHYQHYHFLGITNLLQVLTYMRMAHRGLLPFVTSDSSTYYQKAASKEYLTQTRLSSNISHLNIGQRDNFLSPHSVLPCSCPLCSRLKYMDALSLYGGSAVSASTAFHNAWRYNQYLKAMEGMIDLPLPELSKVLTRQLGKRASLQEGLQTLAFVDEVADTNLAKAIRKYGYFLNGVGGSTGKSAVVSMFESAVAEATTEDHPDTIKRARFLLNQYKEPERQTVLKKDKQEGKKILSSKHKKRVASGKASKASKTVKTKPSNKQAPTPA